jgi:high-affinity iron transporter
MAEIASFVITFREVLEAIIIISVIVGYLIKTKQHNELKNVYYGIGTGIVASILAAIFFAIFFGGFEGFVHEIVEGSAMIIGAILITGLLFWLFSMKNGFAKGVTQKVQQKITKKERYGIFLLVFISIFREGIETVLFLGAISLSSDTFPIIGAIGGIIAALIIGYLLFKGLLRINLNKLFLVTEILLILFAAGLLAHGVHEFQEAGIIPIFVEHIWDVNPPILVEGEYPLLHESGIIGSIAKGLFGWNGNPNLLEVLSWIGYIIFIYGAYKYFKKN